MLTKRGLLHVLLYLYLGHDELRSMSLRDVVIENPITGWHLSYATCPRRVVLAVDIKVRHVDGKSKSEMFDSKPISGPSAAATTTIVAADGAAV